MAASACSMLLVTFMYYIDIVRFLVTVKQAALELSYL